MFVRLQQGADGSRTSVVSQGHLFILFPIHFSQSSEPKSDGSPFHDDETLKRNRKAAEATKKLCRYTTKLEDVVTLAAAGTLPEETFPWVRSPPPKGSTPQYDATSLSAALASKAAHGEAINRYTAEVMASAGGDRGKVQAKRRVKGSRFAKEDGGDGGGGSGMAGSSQGGSAPSGSGSDPFSRSMDAPKPRVYVAGRIVVFVVGGVTQLEIAAMDRLSHATNREVIVGGTSLLTARDFLEQAYDTEPQDDFDGDDDGKGGSYLDRQLEGMEDF